MLGAGSAATLAPKRLFFALWPDEPTRIALAAAGEAAAAGAGIRGRRTPLERIHLTLLFLGDVDPAGEERVRAVADAVRRPAFDLMLDQAGSFPRSRVLWVGPRQAPAALTDLWLELRNGLTDLAAEHNRDVLAPHVTCYRDIDRPVPIVPIRPIRWRADGFVLVHSTLGTPHRYHVVSQWPLQTVAT
jgi:2'-5' RNA ligase